MQIPLVSILIPFKNTAKFLPDCLQSICDQKYKNWEILAVDDHSCDYSAQIVRAFSKRDKRIKLLENDGHGIILALRKAYANSKGQLITRMDSDDLMTPDKIKVMVELLLNHGLAHIAIGKVKYFSEYELGNGYKRYEKWLNKLTQKGTNYSEIYKECVVPSPCWMAYRKGVDACGAFEFDRYPEDYDLAFRFYEEGLECIPCDKILHYWRDYDSRTSRTSKNYAQNYFLDIKLYYFLKLEKQSKRPLVIWGAGAKGKAIAKALVEQGIEIHWVCDNQNKIGKNIYGITLLHYSSIAKLKQPQSIITVANTKEQKMIRHYLIQLNHSAMKDFYFFC
jgi:glycosyltransferase involved in cell wall biosynthesis